MEIDKNTKGFIAVVDDDPEVRSMLVDHLQLDGYQVYSFEDGQKAMKFLLSNSNDAQNIEIVLTDLRMPEVDGLSILRQYHPLNPTVPIIIMTAHASIESAIEGLRKGAFDYLIKPFKLSEISIAVERALMFGRLQRQNKSLIKEVKKTWRFEEIIGKSAAMKNIFSQIEKIAPTQSNVLILGESGTGKELIARAIHNKSGRAQKPFVAINCSAIPGNLLESELFGHTKGAFTGANSEKKGLFEEAEGGTLFLDEIGDMDLALQAKLLRVLQERQIRAVGSNKNKAIDIRILAATHRDLKKAILDGNFREDLYYRLAVLPIILLPLRQRIDDIPLLAQHFLQKYSAINSSRILGFSESAIKKLMSMDWPGNIRELENLVERIVVLTPHPIIQEEDIPHSDNNSEDFFGKNIQDDPSLEDLEKRYIKYILEKTGGKKEKAAQLLGMNRRTLYRKERDYGFVKDDGSEDDESN